MLPQQVSYLGEINNVVQKCAFSFLKLLINKGFGEIKCQSQGLISEDHLNINTAGLSEGDCFVASLFAMTKGGNLAMTE